MTYHANGAGCIRRGGISVRVAYIHALPLLIYDTGLIRRVIQNSFVHSTGHCGYPMVAAMICPFDAISDAGKGCLGNYLPRDINIKGAKAVS
jgi:hypothetical protein